MDSIVKWEYKEANIYDFKDGFAALGQQGWEAVGPIVSGGNGVITSSFLFKRPCGEITITKHISQERNQTDYDGYER